MKNLTNLPKKFCEFPPCQLYLTLSCHFLTTLQNLATLQLFQCLQSNYLLLKENRQRCQNVYEIKHMFKVFI